MPKTPRDLLVALSLSNLWFLPVWLVLLNSNHYVYYFWKADPGYTEFTALAIEILLLAALFWLVAALVDRLKFRRARSLLRWAFLAALIVPLNGVALYYRNVSVFKLAVLNRGTMALAVVSCLALLVGLYRFRPQVVRVAINLVIVLSPLAAVNFASAWWFRMKYAPAAESLREKLPPASIPTRADTPHVIWIIFDELDQNTAFVTRPANTSLPAFDQLRAQSLSAENAYSPGWKTLQSLPALTTGQFVVDVRPMRANELELITARGERVEWSKQANIFSQARAEGFSTGLAGWFHPYCRVIGSSLDWCSWVPVVDMINPALDKLTLWAAMQRWARIAFQSVPLSFRLLQDRYETQFKQDHLGEFNAINMAASALLEKNLNLSLLHFPIPHHPWIYKANQQSLSSDPGNDYLDNVALADRTLGEIRRRLEASGRWDSSIILVTSDHWWRDSPLVNGRRDHRIPFIIKLAGQKSSVGYVTPVNTILTRELLLQLLRGNLTNPNDLSDWLKNNSQVGESPFVPSIP